MSAAVPSSFDAKQASNDPEIERKWAEKAFHHAECYFKLLKAMQSDPSRLKLTRIDDEIYTSFRETFPQDKLAIGAIKDEDLKSDQAKEIWRPFMMQFENKVEDFNFLTLLRLDSSGEYSENNTTVVPRIQFFCIEIARNREGCNKLK